MCVCVCEREKESRPANLLADGSRNKTPELSQAEVDSVSTSLLDDLMQQTTTAQQHIVSFAFIMMMEKLY